MKKIKSALISVYYKDGLDEIVKELHKNNVEIYSTGGTQSFIESLGVPVIPVEDLTEYPSILGGRVKTLHPKIFGGILNRRSLKQDQETIEEYNIPALDLVIVDLYPFEEVVASKATHDEVIEKVDIGGISLIRAAAKNYIDVMVVSSTNQYSKFLETLKQQEGAFNLEQRRAYATASFQISSHYDTSIFNYFSGDSSEVLKISNSQKRSLRYGENPHQKGMFFGDFDAVFKQLHGKELSYNNLLDVDAATNLMGEFLDDGPTFAIMKHNNACGLSTRSTIVDAYKDALAADPVSAFGGVLISNTRIDAGTAELISTLFCEVLIAPSFDAEGLEILKQKKNRILLESKPIETTKQTVRSVLNGYLVQDKDLAIENESALQNETLLSPSKNEIKDLLFANKISKHTKSNTIVLAKNLQLLASGTGQTSRVDALRQAIHKAKSFDFDLKGAVMASDAFFPFPDCVEIAHIQGIDTVIQPGGSIKDQLSIKYCDAHNMKMVFTGIRHFKH
ncbi:MAG: bifunctional phosphoribosylaminoimidazolecarboxamide formyltransferase/IMP cyclohydrolase [Crocinitomicaceae bacterium]|jgi:phosphoribosylaminoimidazolecarboxamide formyltransferase/IMP cyclohydrolase|tara:strand:+ start:17662 stop:19182 length:1521 start_codon:yes stop_codon:yes gene_type:complete